MSDPIQAPTLDISQRPVVNNPDGSYSTFRSMSFQNHLGQEVLIPTVAKDGSKILSNEDAINQYKQTGEHLGIYKNVKDADEAADYYHNLNYDKSTGMLLGSTGQANDQSQPKMNPTEVMDAFLKLRSH